MRFLVLLAHNALRLLTWPLRLAWWRLRFKSSRWVRLRLVGTLEELPRQRGRWERLRRSFKREPRSVMTIRKLVERLARDPKVTGLLVHLEHLQASHATLASLRAQLLALRAAGKRVVCYLPVGADQKELFIASAAERVFAMPHASFSALGPAAARTYLAPLLQRLGLDMLVIAEGRYKTAAEPLTRDSMSDAEREQLREIVGTLLDEWVRALAGRAGLGEQGARRLLERGVFGAGGALELGAIDGCVYEDELRSTLELGAGEPVLDDGAYLTRAGPPPRCFAGAQPARHVALVRLVGTIGGRGLWSGIDLHATAALLRELSKSRRVAGVILYIESPGGSALVSELLHREIAALDAQKPVVAWMGGVAASGGYYLAAATRSIVAQATTLTGSIGVVSLRPVLRRLLDHLHVRRESVTLTPHADLHDFARFPTTDEQELLRGESTRFYDRFLDVVARGRSRSREQIATLAGGRVWTGRDAHQRGLVDVLGGYEEARAELDRFLDGAADVAREPKLAAPKRTDRTPPLPEGAGAHLLRQGELAQLGELLSLNAERDRILAYALGLPHV